MRVLLGLAVLLGLLNTALLTEIGLEGRNTLDHHQEWVLFKPFLQRTPVGFGETRIYRNLLARNRLNLEVFHGYQEVLLNRVVRLERTRFRYRLAEKAFLVVILRKTPEGFTGLRLSRNPDFPPVWFRAEPGGGFLEQRPLDLPSSASWQTCDVTLSEVNGQPFPPLEPGPGIFGFRGSLARAEVDDVELWEDGRPTLRENFRNDRNAGPVALQCAALIAAGSLLVYLVGRHLHWVLLLELLSAVLLGAYLLADYTVWSSAYLSYYRAEQFRTRLFQRLFAGPDPLPDVQDTHAVEDFLQLPKVAPVGPYRLTVYQAGKAQLVPDTLDAVRALPRPGKRILILGTSQTWGEGAARLDDAMVAQLSRLLPDVQFVNAAMRGSNASDLLTRFELHLAALTPDLTVVNLGNNDSDPAVLEAKLTRLAQLTRPLLLVLEANALEAQGPELTAKHEALRRVAAAQRLECFDLNAALLAQEKSGLLWWDKVHPTSYGHLLAARALAPLLSR